MKNVRSSRVTVTIGGEAGFGIMSAGLLLAKLGSRSGYHMIDYTEYPSVIRGGHNVMWLTFGLDPVTSVYESIDVLIALTSETIRRHAHDIREGGVLLYDSTKTMDLSSVREDIVVVPIPCATIAKEVGGTILMKNTAALGSFLAISGGSIDLLHTLLEEEFAGKKPDIIQKNMAVAQAGYDAVKASGVSFGQLFLVPQKSVQTKMVVTGNEAIALGALGANVQFVAIYPMTPTSNVLHVLASFAEEHGLVCIQPEDEISGITMAIGASYAGARSMVATSGGGFCLMTEGYGLAGMIEAPLVIIEGQRGGPATGLPTWTEQGDLQFVLHAHQGEFPRIVLAAGDAEEAYRFTEQAFYLADKYQTPIVVLVDKHLCEGHQTTPVCMPNAVWHDRGKFVQKKVNNYARYALHEGSMSPRSIPGVGNCVVANSDEHDERGYSSEDAAMRRAQMEKRMHKLDLARAEDMQAPEVYGPSHADITIVSWGSTKGAILEALREMPNVNYIHITWMSPFPAESVKRLLRQASRLLLIEANYSGQLGSLIAEHTGITISRKFLKYDGRPFFPHEIVAHIRANLG
jgi:2-oxoglutarate ferredoxin oxidoreductase subunit alpha